MPQYAGQMLPVGNANAVGPSWIPANGTNYSRFGGRTSGADFFARVGWRSGVVGIGRFRIPNSPGWLVLFADNPTGPTLPPDTPNAGNPPTQPAGTITIAAIGDPQAAGAVAVSGTVAPNQPVQCAQVINGTPGGFTPMTVTGTTWSGNVTCSIGSRQIRARLTNQAFIHADSNTFTVS